MPPHDREFLDIDEVKDLVCALRASFIVGLSPEAVELGDKVLLNLAESERRSPPVRWILRTAAGMSEEPPPPRPTFRVIEGG